MSDWFTVLASGSSGNASLLEADGVGLLIDCGLGPRVLGERLAAVGRSWRSVTAVLLTHTHSDHWNRLTLAHLRRLGIPLILHRNHQRDLSTREEFIALQRSGLIREFASESLYSFSSSLRALPVEVPHDADPTFAFRFYRIASAIESWSLGIASDVGHVTRELAAAFRGVDILAIEFNHDVRMQRMSGRPRVLIDRVLGNHGHLSNAQGAELTADIVQSSGPDGFRQLIQLHLSRDCNTPALASQAGREVLQATAPAATLITASQHAPISPIHLVARSSHSPFHDPPPRRQSVQPRLPGLDSV